MTLEAPRSTSAFQALTRHLPGDLRRVLPPMIVYEVGYRLLVTAVATPLFTWMVGLVVARSGSPAVSNTAIAWTLLSPLGLGLALLFALGYLVGQLVLSAGLMALAALGLARRRLDLAHALLLAARSSMRLLQVGAFQLVGLAWVFAPFLGLAALTYGLLLAGHDINYYLAERPPSFLAALAIGALLGVVLLVQVTRLYVGAMFTLPIVLFEGAPIRDAFRESRRRMRGHSWRIGGTVLGWHLFSALLSLAAGIAYRALAPSLLPASGTRVAVLVAIGALLVLVQGWLIAALAFVQVSGACLLSVRFYDERCDGRARAWAERVEATRTGRLYVPLWGWGLAIIGLAFTLSLTIDETLRKYLEIRPVSVTAHRGASKEAPENTLAALRKAIDLGADYAEIDVHLTSDGVPVLVHDEDLLRLAGDPRHPGDMTLEELQRLDVGTPFDPAFAGERVPTLAEAIKTCRGRLRLNIELKPPKGGREPLARAVADLIRAEHFEDSCFVTSLDQEAVRLAQQHHPGLRTGAIVSAAVGDVARLDVDVLSVRTGLVTERLLERAHEARREVHAWTIDDPDIMGRLIDRGVDGLITNDPATAVAVRDERERLPVWQRVLLGLRSRLAAR
jgi:glycerophosphoryl diester phosphodiesterase